MNARHAAQSLLMLCAACAQAPHERLAAHREPIVYGQDDRLELFEHPDPALRELARAALVALVPRTSVLHAATSPKLEGDPLADVYGLCADERFAEQPVIASCSGVLIDEDLVVTAAHCIGEHADGGAPLCEERAFVFDYRYEAAGELAALSGASVYGCKAVVVREQSEPGERPRTDFAIVQLDREVSSDREPVALGSDALATDQVLQSFGFPLGLPAKVDPAARVVDPRSDRGDMFSLRTDAFEGSSGGPVLDREGALVGVLGRGGADLHETDAGCAVATTIAGGEPAAFVEQASYAQRAIDALCASGWQSQRLCSEAITPTNGCAIAERSPSRGTALALVASFLVLATRRVWRAGPFSLRPSQLTVTSVNGPPSSDRQRARARVGV